MPPVKVKPSADREPMAVKPSGSCETCLRALLGDLATVKFAAHSAHVNVTGRDFGAAHALFGQFYEMLDPYLDGTGEWLRRLDARAPLRLEELMSMRSISDPAVTSTDTVALARALHTQIKGVIASAEKAEKAADDAGHSGLCNFLQGLLDETLTKIEWQLRVTVA